MQNWAAVIGSPISHSLSPVLHRTAYELIGVDWDYRSYEVKAQDLPRFLGSLEPGCEGLSVTMPCKQAALQSADVADGLAKLVGSANTIVYAAGMAAAFNTDVHGIVSAVLGTEEDTPLEQFRAENERRGARALILGTGATASSALAAAQTLGYTDVTAAGRSFQKAGNIVVASGKLQVPLRTLLWTRDDLVLETARQSDLIISTVPPSAAAQVLHGFEPKRSQRFLEVTYIPGDAPLTDKFLAAGAPVASALSMLVHQGLAQVKLMTGKEAPFAPVYEAVVAASR